MVMPKLSITAGYIPEDMNPQGFRVVPDVLEHSAQLFADDPAFTSFGRTLSFTELDRLSAAFAVYLQKETDLQPGDRIAIQLPNLIQYPVVLYGALRAGLIVVNTNPLYTAQEMRHQFCDSGAKALIIHKSMAHNVEKILGETSLQYLFVTQVGDLHGFVQRHFLNAAVKYIKKMEPDFRLPDAIPLRSALLKYAGEKPEKVNADSSDVAVLQYTGGTTGVSKGAVLTHANLIANMLQGRERLDMAGKGWDETVITPLPLYHIYAFTVAQVVLLGGGHSVLIPNPRDISGFVKELNRWHMSAFIGLNTLFVALCHNKDFTQIDFSHLKITASGGMALTNAAAHQWEQTTGCEILEGYGLTETSPAVCFNLPHNNRLGYIGLPVAKTEIKVVDVMGEEVEDGQSGELCVKGPQVMQGYWQREVETRNAFTEDGYLHTGDIAVRETDGYVRIVDRAKDVIIVSGFNVYPNEIEDVISEHPDVIECAAVGVDDECSGEAVKVFFVSQRKDLDRATIRDWCREKLSGYKIPKHVERRDELPKTNVGKVLRRMLKE